MSNWVELTQQMLSYCEEESEIIINDYKGFKIALDIPNGGIIGVTILNDREIWGCLTEAFYKDKHYDSDWHINLAKQKIDALIQERQQGQLELTL